ncbi:hypothetical protein O6H91_Y572600 [Diphasiastrum complanatum]|nr:hypothetical protein O6H91_Y572600 [Diphasiastrum complanatum]
MAAKLRTLYTICACWMWACFLTAIAQGQGTWKLLVQNAGISSIHTAVTHFGTVVLLDRTDIGPSMIKLPNGRCRDDSSDLTLTHDCTAHSVLFTPGSNTIRPLFISTDTWCSSGQFVANGTLVQTGGDFDGNMKVRYFTPCQAKEFCDWVEASDQKLQNGRWYATNQLLPDGRQIVVGGRGSTTVEFIPSNAQRTNFLPFLNNAAYYPLVHLLPNGHLFMLIQKNSILYDYAANVVVRTYETIPGQDQGRTYPVSGSSVLLPLDVKNGFTLGEVVVCGGGSYGQFAPASQTCGRIRATDASATWAMETMPIRRTMGDMVLLPTGDVLIINGAQNGKAGWGFANNPALNPVLYSSVAPANHRFAILQASTIPRMYHSTANLLPDGSIFVAGSNSHQFYTFSGEFPTELRLEAFSPPYLDPINLRNKPIITRAPLSISYNTQFRLVVSVPNIRPVNLEVNILSAPFTTHAFSQGQRMLKLAVVRQINHHKGLHFLTIGAPPNNVVAPSAYYMLFVVNAGIPSVAAWVRVL